jgi:hypothetical protein
VIADELPPAPEKPVDLATEIAALKSEIESLKSDRDRQRSILDRVSAFKSAERDAANRNASAALTCVTRLPPEEMWIELRRLPRHELQKALEYAADAGTLIASCTDLELRSRMLDAAPHPNVLAKARALIETATTAARPHVEIKMAAPKPLGNFQMRPPTWPRDSEISISEAQADKLIDGGLGRYVLRGRLGDPTRYQLMTFPTEGALYRIPTDMLDLVRSIDGGLNSAIIDGGVVVEACSAEVNSQLAYAEMMTPTPRRASNAHVPQLPAPLEGPHLVEVAKLRATMPPGDYIDPAHAAAVAIAKAIIESNRSTP